MKTSAEFVKAITAFGAEVRRRRLEAGMTIEAFRARTGLSLGFIGSIEHGQRDPSLETVLRIADGLDVPAGELLGGARPLGEQGTEVAELYAGAEPEIQAGITKLLRHTAEMKRPPRRKRKR